MLFEWGDRLQRLAFSCQIPIFKQCLTMQIEPLQHECLRPSRETTPHNSVTDMHTDTMAALRRMSMRRIVVVVEDGNRDAKEATDDRHERNLAPNRERCARVAACMSA